MVIYEMHVGTFSGLSDGLNRMGLYRDIVDTHLDDLLYLGVNAVELMPITEFDYYESWGYNPVDNWAPEEAYGTPEDLKYTIDVLHQHGIAVILDIVYNHFAASGNYLWNYDGGQIYFDSPACDTPWGAQAAFWKQEVQDYYLENILHWLTQYHVDGFRMDATSYMRDPLGCYSEGWYLMQNINDAIDARGINKISIAEELPDNTAITNPTPGGAGFDSQWHDRFNDDVRQEVFDASFGDPEMWRIRSAVMDSSYPAKTKLVNYVEAHDEADDARLAVVIDSGDPYSVFAKGRSKFSQGLTILAPGIPMFLQGGEWMEDIAFDSGWSNRIDWSKAVSRAPILLFFRDVIKLRKANCAFRSDAQCQYYTILSQDESNNVLAFYRNANDRHLVVVGSLNNSDLNNYRIGFPLRVPGTKCSTARRRSTTVTARAMVVRLRPRRWRGTVTITRPRSRSRRWGCWSSVWVIRWAGTATSTSTATSICTTLPCCKTAWAPQVATCCTTSTKTAGSMRTTLPI